MLFPPVARRSSGERCTTVKHLLAKRFAWPLCLAAFTLIFLSGCATHHAYLVPAPSANLTNGGHAATASANGVTVTVTPNSWQGVPRDLYRDVTPLKVRIENHSNNPVRLSYEDFVVHGPTGETFAALPPSEITGQHYGDNAGPDRSRIVLAAWHTPAPQVHGRVVIGRSRVIITPRFAWRGFYYAPFWGYGYSGLGPWPHYWRPSVGYYNLYYPYMRSFNLPTRSMLSEGLPEGVISPGGFVDGFLYFRKVDPKLTNVDFEAKLQDAKTGQPFGEIEIPFQVEERTTY